MTEAKINYKNQLGHGIYTAPDIARLLGLPTPKVTRYLKTYWDEKLGQGIFGENYSWQSANGKVKSVNFYVLIELHTFFQLQDLGVKPKTILAARQTIANETGLIYPFATSDILSDGRKIWYKLEDTIINADRSRQANFIEIIKQFTKKIDFDSNQIAQKFFPKGRESKIVVNPHHQFGQPVIDGTNINAETIYRMHKSGESIEFISLLYDLNPKYVTDAINFHKTAA
jgi:uncharacterized protein (DUF433 family)